MQNISNKRQPIDHSTSLVFITLKRDVIDDFFMIGHHSHCTDKKLRLISKPTRLARWTLFDQMKLLEVQENFLRLFICV